ncbi:hypothetical protein SARC_14755, partial [Sphaeroforma arctica JP610]
YASVCESWCAIASRLRSCDGKQMRRSISGDETAAVLCGEDDTDERPDDTDERPDDTDERPDDTDERPDDTDERPDDTGEVSLEDSSVLIIGDRMVFVDGAVDREGVVGLCKVVEGLLDRARWRLLADLAEYAHDVCGRSGVE